MSKQRRAQSPARWVLAAALLTGLAVSGALLYYRYSRPLVSVTEAVEGPVVQAFYATGTISPEREYPIKANSPGTLTEVRVDKGARVRKGDTLAVVTDPALLFTERQAQAELDEKRQRADPATSPVLKEFDAKIAAAADLLDIARREQQRISGLLERNAASQTDLDRALDRLKQLWGDLESLKAGLAAKKLEVEKDVKVAEAALSIARWDLEQQSLQAPIDGVVLDRPTALGTRVAVNDQIMRVADIQPENLVMRAAVDEEDIARVRKEQVVRMSLYAFPGEVLAGKVSKIYDQADPDRRTFEVDVVLDKVDSRLSPGMTGELAFVVAQKDRAVVVPSQAVQEGGVFVVTGQRLSRRSVQVGITSVERTEIVTGLRSGEQVLISPRGELSDGHRVRTDYIDPATAAGLNKKAIEEQPFKAFD